MYNFKFGKRVLWWYLSQGIHGDNTVYSAIFALRSSICITHNLHLSETHLLGRGPNKKAVTGTGRKPQREKRWRYAEASLMKVFPGAESGRGDLLQSLKNLLPAHIFFSFTALHDNDCRR